MADPRKKFSFVTPLLVHVGLETSPADSGCPMIPVRDGGKGEFLYSTEGGCHNVH
jgi:hypothetical protein